MRVTPESGLAVKSGWNHDPFGWHAPVFMDLHLPSLSPSARRRRRVATLAAAALVVGLPALAGTPAQAAPQLAASAPVVVQAAPRASAPSASRVRALGDRSLRIGDRGADVKQLQKLLSVTIDGWFGPQTRAAVKRDQRAAGLPANGVVNAATLKAIKKAAATRSRSTATSSRGAMPRAGAPAASKRYAAAYIARTYGWGSGQMSCLSTLWTRESGWRYWVSNPNGIYRGIPQTSSRVWGPMGYSTSQYMNSPEIQIKVGAKYIKSRYGSPCNAWSFWRSHHWY
jgi:peptidoglycan hydrolase-like protein with peptidoglycan-binding domain